MLLCPAALSALSNSFCLFDVFSDKLSDDDDGDDNCDFSSLKCLRTNSTDSPDCLPILLSNPFFTF